MTIREQTNFTSFDFRTPLIETENLWKNNPEEKLETLNSNAIHSSG